MGNALITTSTIFGQNTAFASGVNTETTILSADASYDRRIYGITFTNSATQTITGTFRLKDGSNNIGLAFIVSLTTGVNVMTDIFGQAVASGILQKKKDATGTFYYDIPKDWTLTCQLSANSTSSAYVHVFGESYQ